MGEAFGLYSSLPVYGIVENETNSISCDGPIETMGQGGAHSSDTISFMDSPYRSVEVAVSLLKKTMDFILILRKSLVFSWVRLKNFT